MSNYAQVRPVDVSPEFFKLSPDAKKYISDRYILLGGSHIGGKFIGSDSVNLSAPMRRITSATYFLSKKEISVQEYMLFVNESKGVYKGIGLLPSASPISGMVSLEVYLSDKKYKQFPIIGVSRQQTQAYCDWFTYKLNDLFNTDKLGYSVSVRLPTNADFEMAVERTFNNADDFNNKVIAPEQYVRYSNYKTTNNEPVGPVAVNRNKGRLIDFYNLTGNVAEWVLDYPRDMKVLKREDGKWVETDKYYFRLPESLKALAPNLGMVKGGSFNQMEFYLQQGVSVPLDSNKGYMWVGFRPAISISKRRAAKP